jgi:hypothetical protein
VVAEKERKERREDDEQVDADPKRCASREQTIHGAVPAHHPVA